MTYMINKNNLINTQEQKYEVFINFVLSS